MRLNTSKGLADEKAREEKRQAKSKAITQYLKGDKPKKNETKP